MQFYDVGRSKSFGRYSRSKTPSVSIAFRLHCASWIPVQSSCAMKLSDGSAFGLSIETIASPGHMHSRLTFSGQNVIPNRVPTAVPLLGSVFTGQVLFHSKNEPFRVEYNSPQQPFEIDWQPT